MEFMLCDVVGETSLELPRRRKGFDPSNLTTGNREKARKMATLGGLSWLLSTLLDSRFKHTVSGKCRYLEVAKVQQLRTS
jgi:hypothetical protein